MAKKNTSSLYILVLLALIVLASLVVLIVYFKPKQIISTNIEDVNKICMTRKEYEALKSINISGDASRSVSVKDTSVVRDYRVVNDQLYPPLNRTDTPTHKMLEKNIDARNLYVPTNESYDNFRLVGYLINKEDNKDAGGNNWKLFARDKDRHTSEFYMIPSNNNYDIKIFLTDDIVKGQRLRDLYTIPKSMSFQSPMLNASPYEYVELPKADLTSSRYL